VMNTTPDRCSHCDVRITDPTTQVVHGNRNYCCPNCAHAMEQSGSGSDPQTLETGGDLRCTHCSCVIVDETTMESHGGDAYCCRNCAAAMADMAQRR
jgi:hypothetical protein